jgi:hypothetical protein
VTRPGGILVDAIAAGMRGARFHANAICIYDTSACTTQQNHRNEKPAGKSALVWHALATIV